MVLEVSVMCLYFGKDSKKPGVVYSSALVIALLLKPRPQKKAASCPESKRVWKCLKLIPLTSAFIISGLSFALMNPSDAKYAFLHPARFWRMICAVLKSSITSSVCMGRSTSHNHTSSFANANLLLVNDGLSGGVL